MRNGVLWLSLALSVVGGCATEEEGGDPGETPDTGKADEAEDGCDFSEDDADVCVEPLSEADVRVLEVFDVSALNEDLDPSLPTANVAFYLTDGGRIEWDGMLRGIDNAREVFGAVGIQLRVAWAAELEVPGTWQNLDASEITEPVSGPELRESDLYAHLEEEAARITDRNAAIFNAMVAQLPAEELGLDVANTVHILNLRSVPLSYYEHRDGEWVLDTVGTGGLSFPPYMHVGGIPRHLRGVITLSGHGPLAHELGHKLINVSHEGVGSCPAFEAYGEDLMLYGSGSRIPAGEDGRWQVERLHLSPFLFEVVDGAPVFNPDFQDGGRYADSIYGDYVVDPVCG